MIRLWLIAVAVALPVCACAEDVRISVFTLFHPNQLRLANAAGSTVLIEAGGREIILDGERDRRSVMLRLDHEHLLLDDQPVQSIHAESRAGQAADFTLSVPGRITRRYHGTLNIAATQHVLEAIVAMDIETAVASVVAAESAPSAPLEAMKAQAVAARSFFHAGGHHADDEFCDTTHCQFLREPPPPSSAASIAARETRGLVLTWHGWPFAAMYSGRCGGRTKTLREIGSPVHGYPYFAVECAYCRRHSHAWTRSLSEADGRALEQSNRERARLALDRVHGWSAIPGSDFEVAASPDGFTVRGRGEGHGLGLCQYGAAGMAADGADFAAILRHYYPETELVSIPDQRASR